MLAVFLMFKFLIIIPLFSALKINQEKAALIIVDVQNDFCAGGNLAANHADDVIPVINDLRNSYNFSMIIFTLDWHPRNHVSFYERFKSDPKAKMNSEYEFDLEDGRGRRSQVLWPVHCVQNTIGAALRVGLKVLPSDFMVQKGTNPDVDSYSGFWDNDKSSETELDRILGNGGIQEIVITGLVFDFCVGNTALDGAKKGYKVTVVEDATAFINLKLKEIMRQKLEKSGVVVIEKTKKNECKK